MLHALIKGMRPGGRHECLSFSERPWFPELDCFWECGLMVGTNAALEVGTKAALEVKVEAFVIRDQLS